MVSECSIRRYKSDTVHNSVFPPCPRPDLCGNHTRALQNGEHALPCMQIGSPGQTQRDSSLALEVKPFILLQVAQNQSRTILPAFFHKQAFHFFVTPQNCLFLQCILSPLQQQGLYVRLPVSCTFHCSVLRNPDSSLTCTTRNYLYHVGVKSN